MPWAAINSDSSIIVDSRCRNRHIYGDNDGDYAIDTLIIHYSAVVLEERKIDFYISYLSMSVSV